MFPRSHKPHVRVSALTLHPRAPQSSEGASPGLEFHFPDALQWEEEESVWRQGACGDPRRFGRVLKQLRAEAVPPSSESGSRPMEPSNHS